LNEFAPPRQLHRWAACDFDGNRVKRIILWIITILLFLASAYSLLGLLMVASFSGDPSYSAERARFNGNLWGSLTLVFFFLGALSAFVIWRNRKRRLT